MKTDSFMCDMTHVRASDMYVCVNTYISMYLCVNTYISMYLCVNTYISLYLCIDTYISLYHIPAYLCEPKVRGGFVTIGSRAAF